jgi:PAS domain S-box-containing protein
MIDTPSVGSEPPDAERADILPAWQMDKGPRDQLAELRWIYDTAPIGLAFLTPDCRYLQINQHLTEICGISVADHIGRSVRETVPQVADQVEKIVELILSKGEPITGVEVNGQRPDGTNAARFWLTSWHPLRGPGGAIVGINVVAEEITERKRAEAALAASEARYRDLAETLERRVQTEARERARIWNVSQDMLVVADAKGSFLSVNPAWTSTLGWSEDELIGNTSEWLVHPSDRGRTRDELVRLLDGHRTLRFENRLRHKDGSFCWLSWTAVPDRGLIYAVARDVTELKDAEAALQRSQRELARVSRRTTMGAMTASIAHEINQPLSAIVLNGNAAMRFLSRPEPDLENARAALKHIVEDGHRAGQVIASVRALFGKERGTEKTELNLNDLLGHVLASVQSEMENHRISLQIDLNNGLPRVLGDRVQLQQVFLNLTMNAIEAMALVSNGPRALSVSSGTYGEHQMLVKLRDSGTGIDPSDLDRIFDAFFTTKPNALGMGLAISRSIVEAHGGRLWASAAVPHGSIFHVVLPITDGVADP